MLETSNKIAIKNCLKLKNINYVSCQLKLYDSPELLIINEGYGPSIDTSDEVENIYNNFVQTMEQNFTDNQLITMHNNIKGLKLCESVIPFIGSNAKRFILGDKKNSIVSHYSTVDNSFTVNKTKNIKHRKQAINQELLYMSASRIDGLNVYSGFAQGILKLNIGNGINKGYVSLLNEKYFEGYNIQPNYLFLKETMRLIETIVGSNKMENMYFSNNLKELRDYLAVYVTKDAANSFILDTDLMAKNFNYYNRIITFINRLFDSKITQDYEMGIIGIDEYNRLNKFLQDETQMMSNIVKEKNNHKQYINIIKNRCK